MPEVKHTPGSWVIRQNNTYDSQFEILIEGRNDGHDPICLCRQKHARLIAAAPALLEALEGLVERYDEIIDFDDVGRSHDDVAVVNSRAAIKLAKGE